MNLRSMSGLLFLLTVPAYADDVEKTPLNEVLGLGEEVSVGAFIDTNFSYGANDFQPRTRTYLTQPTRDREPGVNLGFGEIKLNTDRFRGRLAVQGGQSVEINYAAEPEQGWKYIQEGYLGTRLGENLWLDAGIYFSHIGIENWVSRENWAYTRSLMSEFSPYYQSGVKLTYDPTPELNLQLHYMNGWQNISDFSGRNAIGFHAAYKLEDGTTLSYNNFLGNELEGTRFFNNFIVQPAAIGKFEYAAAFDVGTQDRLEGANQDQWMAWVLLGRYSVTDAVKLTGRVEQYFDPDGVIVSTPSGDPFKTVGVSIGVDVELAKRLWWRTEYRALIGQDAIFPAHEADLKDTDQFVVTSLSFTL